MTNVKESVYHLFGINVRDSDYWMTICCIHHLEDSQHIARMSCAVHFMSRLSRHLYHTSRLSLVCWFLPIGHQSLLRYIIDFPNNFLSHVMSQRSEWRELCSNSFWLTWGDTVPNLLVGTSLLLNQIPETVEDVDDNSYQWLYRNEKWDDTLTDKSNALTYSKLIPQKNRDPPHM